MADLEKVIEGLECCVINACTKCPYHNGIACVDALMPDALSLLKAQEPVKPFVTGNGHTFEEAETWWYECGNCNAPIDPNDQYCRHCGRAVKWND